VRSRSAFEYSGIALGAVAEGIWCGALAAALTGSSWLLSAVFSAATVAAAAYLARWAGVAEHRARVGRLLSVTLIAVAACLLVVAGRAWEHPYVVWHVVRDVVFAGGLTALGVYLGRDASAPDAAVRRAVRAFALLCAVLVCAALAGSTPGWAAPAVVAALVVGGLLIAVVRYRSLTGLVSDADRLPAWPWLLAVAGALLSVVAVAALVGQLLSVDVLRWTLDVLGALLGYVLGALAYLVGWAGAGLLRAATWVLGLVHIHATTTDWTPPLAPKAPTISLSPGQPWLASGRTRLILTVVGAVAAVAASVAVVLFALRRLGRRPAGQLPPVVEEREALRSLSSAAGTFAGGLGRLLRRRLSALRRREPLSPAELVRRRYAQLERRLTAAGHARSPGKTVRDFLMAVAAQEALPVSMPPPPPVDLAADLATLYELARYSAHTVDGAQARRFEELAQAVES